MFTMGFVWVFLIKTYRSRYNNQLSKHVLENSGEKSAVILNSMHLHEDIYLSLSLLTIPFISFESEITSQRLILKVHTVVLGAGGTLFRLVPHWWAQADGCQQAHQRLCFSHEALLETQGKNSSDKRAKMVCFPSGQPSVAGG